MSNIIGLDSYKGSKIEKNFMPENDGLEKSEKIFGGAGDNKSIEEIAKKYNVSIEFANKQLKRGIEIESEHTKDIEVRKEIATDHLWKDGIDYYIELDKMESKLDENLEKGLISQDLYDKAVFELNLFKAEKSLNPEIKSDIQKLLKKYNGEVPDSKVHELADKYKIDTHKVESYIYGIASRSEEIQGED